jgi:predicted nucleotidyltransferase
MYLARIDDLKAKLSAMLGRPVDVIVEPTTRPRLQQEINRDRQLAF